MQISAHPQKLCKRVWNARRWNWGWRERSEVHDQIRNWGTTQQFAHYDTTPFFFIQPAWYWHNLRDLPSNFISNPGNFISNPGNFFSKAWKFYCQGMDFFFSAWKFIFSAWKFIFSAWKKLNNKLKKNRWPAEQYSVSSVWDHPTQTLRDFAPLREKYLHTAQRYTEFCSACFCESLRRLRETITLRRAFCVFVDFVWNNLSQVASFGVSSIKLGSWSSGDVQNLGNALWKRMKVLILLLKTQVGVIFLTAKVLEYLP